MAPDAELPDGLTSVEPGSLPPVLYVPCVEPVADVADVQLMYRQTKDGRVAFLAYTALDRLGDGCGADQPWVLLTLEALRALHRAQPWDLLVLDIVVPDDRRPLTPMPPAEVGR